jgi:O-antigen ligase
VAAEWPTQTFHIAVFALLAWSALRGGITSSPVLLLPVFGAAQLLAGASVAPWETREMTVHWAALAGVFCIARTFARSPDIRWMFLSIFLMFGAALAVLTLLTLNSSANRVAWFIACEPPGVAGTFTSPNNYAQFVELALPLAAWFAIRDARRVWGYAIGAGVLYASVIATASRAGAFLCTAEVVSFLPLAWKVRAQSPRTRAGSAALWLIPATALAFTLVAGWDNLSRRFLEADPYGGRREYVQVALNMVRQRPLTGFGLGGYSVASNAFAVKDFPFYPDHAHPNHVHNDWLEFAVDGGIFFSAAVLAVFVAGARKMLRHPWSWGLAAVALHALVDYPFPRPAVSGWMFALLGLLYAAD